MSFNHPQATSTKHGVALLGASGGALEFTADLDAIGQLGAVADNELLVGTGAGTWAYESGATLHTSLGLAIGTDVQAFDAVLDDLSALSPVADNEIIVGTGAGTYAHESGDTARTSLGLGTGDNVQFTDGLFTGNLEVQGTTTTVDSETVLIADNYLALNNAYVTEAAQSGGIVVRSDPEATASEAVAGAAFTATTVEVADGSVFAVGDIIAVDGANNADNDGYYEIESIATDTLTIDATPQEDFSKAGFTADATVAGTVTVCAVSVNRATGTGTWEFAFGSTVPLSYTAFGSGSGGLGDNNTWTGTNDFQDAITTEAIFRDHREYTAAGQTLTIDATDHIVSIKRAATDALTVALPAATGSGRELVIKRHVSDASTSVTLDASGAETIDGETTISYVAAASGPSATLIDSASGEWIII